MALALPWETRPLDPAPLVRKEQAMLVAPAALVAPQTAREHSLQQSVCFPLSASVVVVAAAVPPVAAALPPRPPARALSLQVSQALLSRWLPAVAW